MITLSYLINILVLIGIVMIVVKSYKRIAEFTTETKQIHKILDNILTELKKEKHERS